MKNLLKKIKQNIQTYRLISQEETALYTSQCNTPSSIYRTNYKNSAIQPNTFLYESYAGRGMICNPYGIFKSFLSRSDFFNYKHYWVIDDMDDNLWNIQQYKQYSNVYFIQYKSPEYYYHLASCQYIITNVAFQAPLTPIKGQTYINTWHGIPLKTLGFDIPNGNISSRNTLRNFVMCDYIISPNPFMSQIYHTAFRLHDIYNGTILEEGQPRNDTLFHTNAKEIMDKLKKIGVAVDYNKKIILYAPTWRGTKYEEPDTDILQYQSLLQTLENNIDTNQYQIFIKPHQIVYKYMKKDTSLSGKLIPATIDTNELLAITDLLISDFSSIFFDYLITDRPVLFYIPDLEEYKQTRGLYHSIDRLPGPVTDKISELPSLIENINQYKEVYKEKYQTLKTWACPHDDGNVCQRLLDSIFKADNHSAPQPKPSDKIKLAFYGGYMDDPRISVSLFALLKNLNYEHYDVTLLVTLRENQSNYKIISEIDPRVRVLTYLGPYNSTLKENIRYHAFKSPDLAQIFRKKVFPETLFQDEALRIFGNATFDYVVDFVGTDLFFSCVFLYVSSKHHYIWQHSDMKMLQKHFPELHLDVIFSLYPNYEKIIVSDSKVLNVNRKNELSKGIHDKYVCMPNTFFPEDNFDQENSLLKIDHQVFFIKNRQTSENTGKQKDYYLLPFPKNENIFLTVSNFTADENLSCLINAFDQLRDYNSILFIVGDGPEKNGLEKKIKKLKLEKNIILTGTLTNICSLMELCNCFVIPTAIHGITTYALQAQSLGLSLIIESKKDDLYKKVDEFIQHHPKTSVFDSASYLSKAYEQFQTLFPRITDKE